MKIGTKSLLFGCHQVLLHPVFVLWGWVYLYGLRTLTWQILIAVVIHDWGYWGCQEMDGPQGSLHPTRLKFLEYLPSQTRFLIKYHSRHLSKRLNTTPSRLCWADKLGTGIMSSRLWAILAYMSGEGKEYTDNPYCNDYVKGEDSSLKGLVLFHRKYKLEYGINSRRWSGIKYDQ